MAESSSAMRSTGGPSMSMIENSVNAGSVGVGNYKGVMLCNRPFGGSTVANKQPNNASAQVFNCGVVPEAIGLNVPISDKEKLTKRPKKDSVLAKHKKWLIELQKTKDRLESEYLDDLKRKEEQQQRFQETQKRMREASRTIMKNNDDAKDSKGEIDSKGDGSKDDKVAKDSQINPSASAPALMGLNNNELDAAAEEMKAQPKSMTIGGKKGQFKPAWAMTEKAADDQLDDIQFEEENDLIDFARSLDFDKYIDDVEVQTMMTKLRSRITELEKEVAMEDQREMDAESRAAMSAKLEQMGQIQAGLANVDAKEISAESAAMNAARALLQEEEEMKAVHSAKSTASLLQQAKEKIETVKISVQGDTAQPGSPYVKNEPLIVVHEPNEGTRLGDKNLASNLPYLRRNPAAV